MDITITVALDGSLVRNLTLTPGDEVTISVVVYEHDGDETPLTVTNPSFATGSGEYIAIDSEFTVSCGSGRTPYRLAVDIDGTRTTVAHGYIESPFAYDYSCCFCDGLFPAVLPHTTLTVADANGFNGTATTEMVPELTIGVTFDGIALAEDGGLVPLVLGTGLTLVDGQLDTVGGATGDVVGPAASIDNEMPLFSGTSGKLLKRSSATGVPLLTGGVVSTLTLDTDGTLSANSDTRLATQKAVKTYADQLIAAADAMVFKGVIDCSANPNYPAADKGWTYRVSVAGKIGGASGVNVEIGDLLLCLVDGSASGNQATVGANWSIAQTNVDGAVIGPTSATNNNLAAMDGVTGKLIKDAGIAISAVVTLTGTQTLTGKTLTAPVINSPTGIVKADVGLGNVDNTSNATERAATATLTNKRITSRVLAHASSATPTINTDNYDVVNITGLATNISSFTTNLSGTPVDSDFLIVNVTDNGTPRTLAFGASFEASTVALPTTTVASAKLSMGFMFNGATTKWRLMGVA